MIKKNRSWKVSMYCKKCGKQMRNYPKEEEAGKWISIEDRLPNFEFAIVLVEDGSPIGDRFYDKRIDMAYYNTDNKRWGSFVLYDWAGGEITHWMPLPEIPSKSKQSKDRK